MAILGGAALVGGGLAAGSYFGNQAASAQRHAAGDAAARIEAAKGRAVGYLQPYSKVGQGALSPLSALLLGKSYDPANGQFTDLSSDQRMQSFFQSPAYQFNLTQGLDAINKSQVARGGAFSGGALKEVNDYAQGQASNEYGNYLNSLFGLAGIGESADTAKANIEIGAGSDLASLAYAGGMGNANKYNSLSNFGYGIGGLGIGGLMGGSNPSGGGGAGSGFTPLSGGRYNSGYANGLGSSMLSPSTSLSMGGGF